MSITTSKPIIRPTLPPIDDVRVAVGDSWSQGIVTVGGLGRSFESESSARCGVSESVALASCTAGLMLVPQAIGISAGSEVIVPSFTFAATAQALLWNRLVPVFCDCIPGTLTLDPEDVERNLSATTAAICAAYVYGLPPDVDELLGIGKRRGIPVYFDSAQGLGATYKGKPAGGFGACEVFSLSPTKVVTAIEGGLVTTNDGALAADLRSMRDYGKDPERGEDMIHLGLSARMSELHAAVGLLSLRNIGALVAARLRWIEGYRERLGRLPGCRVQEFPSDRTSSGNYFVLFIGPDARRSRDEVYDGLAREGIQTKRYFYPPLHKQTVFQKYPMRLSATLVETERASAEALALPLYSHMTDGDFEAVCRGVEGVLA